MNLLLSIKDISCVVYFLSKSGCSESNYFMTTKCWARLVFDIEKLSI